MQKGILVFDPAVAGAAGKTLPPAGPPGTTGSGGGSISGAGTYYSKPTWMGEYLQVAETVVVTGTLAGALTLEVTVDTREDDLVGLATWVPFTPATAIPAIAGAVSFGRSDIVRYAGYRMVFTWSANSGTLAVKRLLKRY